MQIILDDAECRIIHDSLLETRKRLLHNMSYGKDIDTEEKNVQDLHWVNELIGRMENYVK